VKYLPLVWRNLLRKKTRTLLTIGCIFIAFLLFGVLMAVRAAFTMGVEIAGADRLTTIHKVSLIQLLPRSYFGRIKSVEGVTSVTHANWFGAYFQDPSNGFFANMAVDPETFLDMYPEFEIPGEQQAAFLRNRTGAIVGADLARRYDWKVGDRIPLISPIYPRPDGTPWEFTVEGIYDSSLKGTDKNQLFFHWDYINETFRDVTQVANQVGWYVIRVKDPARADELAQRVDALFANSSAETKTATEKAFIAGFANQVGDIGSIMIAIAGIVMFFITFVAGVVMAQSIRERTNELAVLKTLGFGDGLVLAMVLVESCAIAAIGGGLGLAAAWALIAQGDPTNGLLPAFYFPVRDLGFGVALLLVLGFATGLLPARQAQRLRIVNALRRA
jgi:putative ABC transport system permease protein